jgi:hypothetical protein
MPLIAGVASFSSFRCVPYQGPDPSVASCQGIPGYISNGGYFGSYAGHVAVGFGANYSFINANVSNVTPEPATLALLATGLIAFGGLDRRRRRRRGAARSA